MQELYDQIPRFLFKKSAFVSAYHSYPIQNLVCRIGLWDSNQRFFDYETIHNHDIRLESL